MHNPALIPLGVLAAILIVVGRLNHRRRWGNWTALAGYVLLALGAVIVLDVRA